MTKCTLYCDTRSYSRVCVFIHTISIIKRKHIFIQIHFPNENSMETLELNIGRIIGDLFRDLRTESLYIMRSLRNKTGVFGNWEKYDTRLNNIYCKCVRCEASCYTQESEKKNSHRKLSRISFSDKSSIVCGWWTEKKFVQKKNNFVFILRFLSLLLL